MADEKKVTRFTSWLPLDENIDGAVLLKLRREDQRLLGCATNEDVFIEYPFAFVPTDHVKSFLIRTDSPFEPFREEIEAYKDTTFLFGYASTELDAEDFIICLTQEARDAFMRRNQKITRKILDMVMNRVKKTPKPWKDLGSAEELECNFVKNSRPLIEIELMLPASFFRRNKRKIFDDRDAMDVRDGYVEILPNKEDYKNVYMKRISIACQSDLPRCESGTQTYTGYPVNKCTQYEYSPPEEVLEIWNEGGDAEEELKETTNVDVVLDEAELEKVKRKEELIEKRKKEMEKLRDFLARRADEMIKAISYNAAINIYVDDILLLNTNPENAVIPKDSKVYEERFNLLNLAMSEKKKIRSASWHCDREGVIVCCYNLCSQFQHDSKVMVWTLSIVKQPIMTLLPEKNISRVSCCPFAGSTDTVIGGTVNGTVMMWDLQDYFQKGNENLDDENLDVIRKDSDTPVVQATMFSDKTKSHELRICNITWLPQWCRMTSEGTLRRKAAKSLKDRNPQFVTASVDGSVLFWELPPPSSKLSIETSPLIHVKKNNLIEPIYRLLIEEPKEKEAVRITINCFCISPFKPEEPVEFKDQQTLERWHKFYVGSSNGEILCCTWTGQSFGIESNGVEKCQILTRIYVHDGPVMEMSRFFHLEDVFLTIGGRIWAIWKEDYMESPVLWRRMKESQYTASTWSNRVGIFLLARADGGIEAWDISKVADAPVASNTISDELFGIICMACASPAVVSATHWFLFVVVSAFILTLVWCFLYLLSLREALKIPLDWVLTELINTAVVTVLYFTAFIAQMAVWTSFKSTHFVASNIAAGVFGIFNTVAYAAGIYFLFLEWKSNRQQ